MRRVKVETHAARWGERTREPCCGQVGRAYPRAVLPTLARPEGRGYKLGAIAQRVWNLRADPTQGSRAGWKLKRTRPGGASVLASRAANPVAARVYARPTFNNAQHLLTAALNHTLRQPPRLRARKFLTFFPQCGGDGKALQHDSGRRHWWHEGEPRVLRG